MIFKNNFNLLDNLKTTIVAMAVFKVIIKLLYVRQLVSLCQHVEI